MEINEIKCSQDVYKFMTDNIEYGWIDINGNKHLNTMKEFRKIYRTMSIEEILKYKIGTCIDQVNLMHYLLNKINVKNKMYCCRIFEPDDYENLEEEEHMHCFVLFYENNKVYHMEHPNFNKKGIYEYNSEEEAIKTIVDYYIKLRGGKDSPTKEFYEIPVGINFKEFNKYINHVKRKENKMPNLYIITGPAGVGKSTISKKIAESKEKSALIEGDDIYHQVVGGYIQAWKDGNHLDTFWKVCISTIRTYLEDGYDVIFNYIVTPTTLKQIKEQFKDYTIKFVVLLVDEKTLLLRDKERPEDCQMNERCITLLKSFKNNNYNKQNILETSNFTVNETVEIIENNDRFIL